MFKVFLTTGSSSVVYMTGKKMILPATEAASDALDRMGRRKFMDQMVEDAVQQVQGGMADERDISTIKEYRQFVRCTGFYHHHFAAARGCFGGLALAWSEHACDPIACVSGMTALASCSQSMTSHNTESENGRSNITLTISSATTLMTSHTAEGEQGGQPARLLGWEK
jgi:hypothetical protein